MNASVPEQKFDLLPSNATFAMVSVSVPDALPSPSTMICPAIFWPLPSIVRLRPAFWWTIVYPLTSATSSTVTSPVSSWAALTASCSVSPLPTTSPLTTTSATHVFFTR